MAAGGGDPRQHPDRRRLGALPGGARADARSACDKPDGDPWGSHFFLLREPPTLVGWGGFKGPPVAGSVEVGYAVAPEYEGRGIATAAVALLLAKAAASGEVEVVTAHTLAEPNASTKVLEHAGFERDPELALEGEREVWEWRRPLSPPAPGQEQR